MERIVVAGVNARNIVRSARISGFEVYSIAKYCDEDLKLYSKSAIKYEDIEEGIEKLKCLCESYNLQAVCSTGFERFAKKLSKKINLIGSYDYSCLDKLKFYKKLKKSGINCPELLKKGEDKTKLILKPRFGGGGVGTKLLYNLNNKIYTKDYILQEFIEGVTVSAIVVCSEGKSKCLTLNLLLSGYRSMNAYDFLYSGNITPLHRKQVEKIFSCKLDNNLIEKAKKMAEETALLFETQGCAGIDMIISSKDVYVIEMNPRIPGSLDSFEISFEKSLFKIHYNAFYGKMEQSIKPKRFGLRMIYYAPRKLKAYIPICNPFFSDIPSKGEIFYCQQPVTSILASGQSILKKLYDRKKLLEENFLRWLN